MTADDQPKGYVFRVLLYLDIFIGSLFARDPDVTISSYCGLALRENKPGLGQAFLRCLGRVLNFIVKNHCDHAIANDAVRAQQALKRLGL